jgi:hypothetical protein
MKQHEQHKKNVKMKALVEMTLPMAPTNATPTTTWET